MTLRQALVTATAVLVCLDLAGGLVAVATGVNGWGEAWSGDARLAAPWPMVLLQVAALVVAVRARRRFAVVAAASLALACLVSGISGFFDGGFAADELAPGHVAFQVVLLGWTALVGVAAAVLTARLARRSPRTEVGSPAAG